MEPAPPQPWDRYRGTKAWGWYLDDLENWQLLLATAEPVKALEVGGFEGISANLMLDLLFTHPDSEIHAIDPFLPDPTTPEVDGQTRECFEQNCATGGHEDRIKLYEGLSSEVLAWMASAEGFWQSFDFIYIDGSHLAKDVFIDAALSWHLLKPGGILAFDDYGWGEDEANPVAKPRLAIDAFSSVFRDHLQLLHSGWRRIYRKTEGLSEMPDV
ncbi:MAG TPA: class I SAM-dependent methyltransferase [Verrucomicrobiales bacterium]|jgi:predicted O-methyltransferase YrrM|nr:class I SAM-dependent methyltransferase [Verrucomicrobiales bacterium]